MNCKPVLCSDDTTCAREGLLTEGLWGVQRWLQRERRPQLVFPHVHHQAHVQAAPLCPAAMIQTLGSTIRQKRCIGWPTGSKRVSWGLTTLDMTAAAARVVMCGMSRDVDFACALLRTSIPRGCIRTLFNRVLVVFMHCVHVRERVCVCEREREREGGREGGRGVGQRSSRERKGSQKKRVCACVFAHMHLLMCCRQLHALHSQWKRKRVFVA